MVSLGRLVFKATGVMSNRGVVKNSRKIATAIVDRMKQSGGKIESAEVEQIISDTIGKKAAKKIKIVDSKDQIIKFMQEQGAKSTDIDKAFEIAGGWVQPNKYSRKASLFINEEKIAKVYSGNTYAQAAQKSEVLAHEIQHAISFTSGRMSLGRIKGRFSFGRKMIDKLKQKGDNLDFEHKYMQLQEECIKPMRQGKQINEADIVKILYAKGILQVGKDKENAFILKKLRDVYKDECRSYDVGYGALEAFTGQKNSEIIYKVQDLFKNFVKVTDKELQHARLNQVKRFFGLKPNNAREQAIIQEYEAQQAQIQDFAKAIRGNLGKKVKAFTPTEN